jgi:DNA (cytosine-5)-methyltransferase 1
VRPRLAPVGWGSLWVLAGVQGEAGRTWDAAVKPRLLDLFCGAGGAAMGYHRAGFEVVGIDIRNQPHYPFAFHLGDALEWLSEGYGTGFDAIHASPPCQAFTAYRRTCNVGEYPDLVAQTRELLQETGLPYVIENVEGAPLIGPVLICGSMFDPAMDIRRHRLFEANWPLEPPMWPCRHKLQAPARFKSSSTRRPNSRKTIEIGSWDEPLARQQAAMGIDWSTLEELSEAIPPAYTEFIGAALLAHLGATRHE